MTAYAERTGAVHLDGTPIFQTADDQRNEREVADLVARAFRCEIVPLGLLAAVDWWAVRDGRPVAMLELKSRTHASTRFADVFLNVRKWLALMLGPFGMGLPALYVVRFTDGVRWINVLDVDARMWSMGGTAKRVKSSTDREPVINVPISAMKVLG